MARNTGFDWVEGKYFEQTAALPAEFDQTLTVSVPNGYGQAERVSVSGV